MSQHVLAPVLLHVPVPTLMALLGIAKQDHDAHSEDNASGYEVLHPTLQSKL